MRVIWSHNIMIKMFLYMRIGISPSVVQAINIGQFNGNGNTMHNTYIFIRPMTKDFRNVIVISDLELHKSLTIIIQLQVCERNKCLGLKTYITVLVSLKHSVMSSLSC